MCTYTTFIPNFFGKQSLSSKAIMLGLSIALVSGQQTVLAQAAKAPVPATKPGAVPLKSGAPAAAVTAEITIPKPKPQPPLIKVDIGKGWRFIVGDNPGYRKNTWVRKDFKPIEVGRTWDSAGYPNTEGVAWYINEPIIPYTMAKQVDKYKYISIDLGEIDDADSVFFNQLYVGSTGSMGPVPVQGSHLVKRHYLVPVRQIRFGLKNLIAVKVYNAKGKGGMVAGPYSLQAATWEDWNSIEVVPDPKNTFALNSSNVYTLHLRNKNAEVATKGVTIQQVFNDKNQVVWEKKTNNGIKPGGTSEVETFDAKVPGFYHLKVTFYEAETGGTLVANKVLGYVAAVGNAEPFMAGKPVVADKVPQNFSPEPFENIKLTGYLGKRIDVNFTKRLLAVDEEALLEGYEHRPGKQDWVGEHIGKYLYTACNYYRYTRSPELKIQMDRMLYRLILTQDSATGYLGTYTPEKQWTSWDVWVHKYNMIGLLSYYEVTGYTGALNSAKRIADLLDKTFGDAGGKRDIIASGTHVGMAATSVLEPMVDLYRFTGDNKYLDFCKYILRAYEQPNGPHLLSSLSAGGKVNETANGKAYEMLSNLVGLTKYYQVTADENVYKAVQNGWKDVVENQLYIVGSTSSKEHFQPAGNKPAGKGDNFGEGCVTTTWLQLNLLLYSISGDIKYVDQLEKTVYNQLLASESPVTGCVSYYTPLQDKKEYSCNITCCLSSVPRGISLIPSFTAGNYKNGIAINLHNSFVDKINIPTPEAGKTQVVTLQYNSRYPEEGAKSEFTVNPAKPQEFSIFLRVPAWCTKFEVNQKGETKIFKGTPGQYLEIKREWKKGEKFEVNFDVPVQFVDGAPGYPGYIALVRGAQVLAVDSSVNKLGLPIADVKIPGAFPEPAKSKVKNAKPVEPGLKNARGRLPVGWEGTQAYSIPGAIGVKPAEIVLVPYAESGQTFSPSQVYNKKQE